jgi:hypothetical protein
MDDIGSPSIALPLVGAALCALFLAVAAGYCISVDDEAYLFDDDETIDPEPAQCSDSVALANAR